MSVWAAIGIGFLLGVLSTHFFWHAVTRIREQDRRELRDSLRNVH